MKRHCSSHSNQIQAQVKRDLLLKMSSHRVKEICNIFRVLWARICMWTLNRLFDYMEWNYETRKYDTQENEMWLHCICNVRCAFRKIFLQIYQLPLDVAVAMNMFGVRRRSCWCICWCIDLKKKCTWNVLGARRMQTLMKCNFSQCAWKCTRNVSTS